MKIPTQFFDRRPGLLMAALCLVVGCSTQPIHPDPEHRLSEIRSQLDHAGNPTDRDAVLAKLNQLYAENQGKLDAGWKLPPGFDYFKISGRRVASPGKPEEVFLRIVGSEPSIGAVTQFQLKDASGKIWVDRKQSIGKWTENRFGAAFAFHVSIEQKPAPGLYTLRLVTKDGQDVQGWVILNDLWPAESPATIFPSAPRYELARRNGVFRWNPFRSSAFRGFEEVFLFFGLSKDGKNTKWKDNQLEFLVPDEPRRTEYRIGDKVSRDDDSHVESLMPGRYIWNLTYQERRHFGPILLMREAAVLTPVTLR